MLEVTHKRKVLTAMGFNNSTLLMLEVTHKRKVLTAIRATLLMKLGWK